jgi:hypothetical protein
MYPRLLQFLDTLHLKVVIQQYFNNILQYLNNPINENIYEINNRSLDIVSLLQSYQRNCDYLNLIDSSDRLYPYVKTLKILLDGLLLVAILFIRFNEVNNDKKILESGHIFLQKLEFKKTYIDYLNSIYLTHSQIFIKNNHYYHYIYNGIHSNLQLGTFDTAFSVAGGSNKKGGVNINSESISIDELIKDYEDTLTDKARIDNELLTEIKAGKKKVVNRKIRRLKKYN